MTKPSYAGIKIAVAALAQRPLSDAEIAMAKRFSMHLFNASGESFSMLGSEVPKCVWAFANALVTANRTFGPSMISGCEERLICMIYLNECVDTLSLAATTTGAGAFPWMK